jgi:hypothetical protein
MHNRTYRRPELVEIGEAEKVTLGCTGSCQDSCNCAKCFEEDPCPVVEAAV